MLKTFSLRQREVPLTVYGPPGLRELFGEPAAGVRQAPYPLELVELRAGETLERDGYRILVFPGAPRRLGASATRSSRIERPGRFDVEAADALGIPHGPERGALQRGESITLRRRAGAHARRGARASRARAAAS